LTILTRLFDNAVDNVPLSSTKRLAIVVLTAAPVCGYSLLWNVSIVNYYSMISDPEKLASFVAPGARALEHLLLFPCLVVLYYTASGTWWMSGRAPLIVFKQLMLVLLFGLLVRPAVYFADHLTTQVSGGKRASFVDFMDLNSIAAAIINYFPIYATGLFFIFALILFERYREEQLRVARLNSSLLRTRLEALRVHLHPHFLFNTLNTVSSLVGAQPEVAREVLAGLGSLLRDSIEDEYEDLHPLERECDLAATYLRIVVVRFGDRVNYSIASPDALKRHLVPHGILITLLENAVTHGVSSVVGASELIVRVATNASHLILEVRNSYKPLRISDAQHRGGLGALQARLRVLYGEAFSLESRGDGIGVWSVHATLPLDMPK
jgi:two-component system, LytTR family, sensor kinase